MFFYQFSSWLDESNEIAEIMNYDGNDENDGNYESNWKDGNDEMIVMMEMKIREWNRGKCGFFDDI